MIDWIESRLLWGSVEIMALAALVALTSMVVGRRRERLCALIWLLVPLKALLTLVPVNRITVDPTPVSGWHTWWGDSSAPHVEGHATTGGGTPPSARAVSDVSPLPRWLNNPVLAAAKAPILTLWFGGFLINLAGHLFRFTQMRMAVGKERGPSEAVRCLLQEEAHRCGLRRTPRLVVGPAQDTPALFCGPGVILLLPDWLVAPDARQHLRWALRHELTHLRHGDHWAVLIQALACSLFWFHPVMWLARREWMRHMERACDDAIAREPVAAREYAVTLVAVLNRICSRPAMPIAGTSLFAMRTETGRRISRLMSQRSASRSSLGPFGYVGVAVAAVLLAAFGLHPEGKAAASGKSADTSLKVDLGPDDQRVEPGWVRWSGDRDKDFSTNFDDDFEIEIDRNHAWRDRGETNLEEPLSRVLRDGLRERDDRDIRLTFKRLDPGIYLLELFSCDFGEEKRTAVGRLDLQVDGSDVLTDLPTIGRASAVEAALPPISLQSSGDKIVVALKRRKGDIWLNGFILSKALGRREN